MSGQSPRARLRPQAASRSDDKPAMPSRSDDSPAMPSRSDDSPAMVPPPQDLFAVATIVAPHGVEGWVRALILSSNPDDLPRLRRVVLDKPAPRWSRLRSVRLSGKFVLLLLEDVDSRDRAELLRDCLVSIPRSEARPLPEGHYFVADIIGIEVVTEDGRSLGRVREVQQTGANDVYHTDRALIPATREAVISLDVAGQKMIVRPELVVET